LNNLKLENFLILDFGTSNGRASIAKFNGNKFSIDDRQIALNSTIIKNYKPKNTTYWDAIENVME
jgi:ribulose kinase